MATLRLFLVAGLVALPLWVASTAPTYACSCASLPAGDLVARVGIVVVGTVHDVRLASATSGRDNGVGPSYQVGWEFDVEEYIKGTGPAQLSVHSRADLVREVDGVQKIVPGLGASCGWAPQEGHYILFVGVSEDGTFETGGCTPNMLRTPESETQFERFLADIRTAVAAEQITLPPTGSYSPGGSAPIVPLAAASALAGIGLAANSAFVLRRRS